uniref:DUF1618 domain-containing protein n=1 Tax=Oryza punctata TaxID=4537 RepID=A0A0E0MNN8_ORYPU
MEAGRSRPPKGRRSPPDLVHGWIILDRFVHSRHGDVGDDDVTASEIALTCSGRRIRVSLRVADPPAVSRLYSHRLDQPWPDAYSLRLPRVVAAHRGSILFWARVPFEDDEFVVPGYFPVDYFVYTAGAASPPSLTRLPPCFIDGHTPDPEDHYFKPYRKQRQRIMLDENVGFLSHDGDGEFTVANITIRDWSSLNVCILNHHEGSPSPGQWTIQRLEMQRTPIRKQMRRKLSKWVNDVVLPLHDRYLCLVDHYKGILLVDTKELQYFKYIPLPEEAMVRGCRHYEEDDPDPARCALVTCNGLITLVCIYKAISSKKNKSAPAFIIKSWSLVDIHTSRWLHDFTMEADEFWNLCAQENQLLPLVTPSFPVVSLVDPHAISFLLKDDDKGLYWLVEVDMRNKALLSPAALYINEEEEERCSGDKHWKFFDGHYFIPSWFTSYLHEDPIQSRQLSQMMQKAKQQRTMHKIGRQQCGEMLRQEREKQKNGLEAVPNSGGQGKTTQKAKQERATLPKR